MKPPEYLGRLNEEQRTSHPCINCLLETEDRIRNGDFDGVSAGDKIWYKTYKAEIEKLAKVLTMYQPKTLIEVGSGSGRIIQTILDVLPNAKINGIEFNKQTFDFVKKRFSNNNMVKIEKNDIYYYLSNEGVYDMAICLMNTFGNINDVEVFRRIVSHSNYFVFSLYNKKLDNQRKSMYEARGHTNFNFVNEQYCFQDDWIKGLISRSYTKEEIKNLVTKSGSDIIELEPIELLYFGIAKKINNFLL